MGESCWPPTILPIRTHRQESSHGKCSQRFSGAPPASRLGPQRRRRRGKRWRGNRHPPPPASGFSAELGSRHLQPELTSRTRVIHAPNDCRFAGSYHSAAIDADLMNARPVDNPGRVREINAAEVASHGEHEVTGLFLRSAPDAGTNVQKLKLRSVVGGYRHAGADLEIACPAGID